MLPEVRASVRVSVIRRRLRDRAGALGAAEAFGSSLLPVYETLEACDVAMIMQRRFEKGRAINEHGWGRQDRDFYFEGTCANWQLPFEAINELLKESQRTVVSLPNESVASCPDTKTHKKID